LLLDKKCELVAKNLDLVAESCVLEAKYRHKVAKSRLSLQHGIRMKSTAPVTEPKIQLQDTATEVEPKIQLDQQDIDDLIEDYNEKVKKYLQNEEQGSPSKKRSTKKGKVAAVFAKVAVLV